MSRLDETRLENVKLRHGGGFTSQCPACFEDGHDKTGNHLVIFRGGSFACVQYPGNDGIEHRKRIFELVGIPDKPAKKKSPCGFPTLELAIQYQERKLKMKATRRDWYNQRFLVVRLDPEKGRKEFRPFHLSDDGWVCSDPPGKLPLFNLEALRERTDGRVVLVEGEKCVTELSERTGLLVTTSAHGAKSGHKTDWQPLSGREVVIFPDNDADGKKYAQSVANALLNLSPPAKVRIVELPELPEGGDIVDWLESRNGESPSDLVNELRDLVAAVAEERQLPKAALTEVGSTKNLDDYTDNDNGNATLFIDRYSETLRYIHAPIESWFIWDGNRWMPDTVEGANLLARQLSDDLVADSVKEPGRRDERKLKRGVAIGGRNRISSMLWLARSDPRIVIRREEIDADNFLLGVRNGVIDLRSGRRRDGQKGDFITKSCGCNFDPNATCPRWMAFLDEIFERQTDLIRYIQRAGGYTLTGDTREQVLFFLYGGGANGKSTLIEILMRVLGDYATTASQNILTFNKHVREPLDEIAALVGSRFVAIAETGESDLAEVRIKQLTGGDTITGKAHYEKAASFQPKFKLWIFGNSRPSIHGVDHAMWRRIMLIPFNRQFSIDEQDPTLKEKLLLELPGILNWAIEGALAWQKEGRQIPPESVRKATDEYRADEDVLRDFIAENVEKADDQQLAHKDLYHAYKAWNSDQGSDKAFSNKRLVKMFKDRAYKSFLGAGNVLSWWGIRLKNEQKS
jgi:putative DNA primase/helicase